MSNYTKNYTVPKVPINLGNKSLTKSSVTSAPKPSVKDKMSVRHPKYNI